MQKPHPFAWCKPCGVAPRVFSDRRRDSNITLLRHGSGDKYTEEPMIRSSRNWKRKTSGLLIVVFILGFLWTEGWAQMTEVNMGIAFVNARVAPLWVAEKEG